MQHGRPNSTRFAGPFLNRQDYFPQPPAFCPNPDYPQDALSSQRQVRGIRNHPLNALQPVFVQNRQILHIDSAAVINIRGIDSGNRLNIRICLAAAA